jgi:hypothetical protein
MSTIKNLAAGLGGAIALNLLHETLKHKKGMPRIDRLGEEAVQKTLQPLGREIENPDNLYTTTFIADIIGNTVYYSTIGTGGGKNLWTRAIAMGIAAGVGAVKLPEPLGLDEAPVASAKPKEAITVGYYVFGALVTAGLLSLMKNKELPPRS